MIEHIDKIAYAVIAVILALSKIDQVLEKKLPTLHNLIYKEMLELFGKKQKRKKRSKKKKSSSQKIL